GVPVDQFHRWRIGMSGQHLFELRVYSRGRHGGDEAHLRHTPLEPRGGIEKARAETGHFRVTTARQQAHPGPACIQAEGAACRGLIRRLTQFIGERMTDVARIDAMALEQCRLERKDGQQAIDGTANAVHAALAPGPDSRADVVHRDDTATLETSFQAGVECRRVNADEHIRSPLSEVPIQPPAQSQQTRNLADNFADAEQRQFADRGQTVATGLFHARAGDAFEFRLRVALAQRLDEAGSELITGGFARNQCETRRGHAQRMMPRSPARSRDSSMTATASFSLASGRSSALACSSRRLERYTMR